MHCLPYRHISLLYHFSGNPFVVKKLSTCYQMMRGSVTSAWLLFSGLPVNVLVYQVHNLLLLCFTFMMCICIIKGKLICMLCMLEHDNCERGTQIFKWAIILFLFCVHIIIIVHTDIATPWMSWSASWTRWQSILMTTLCGDRKYMRFLAWSHPSQVCANN